MIAKSFKKRGINVLAGVKVVKADVTPDSVTLQLEVGGKPQTVTAEKVLMAAGRAVNTENIGLEKVGVKLTDRGFIQVDPTTLQTTVKGVYAIGDVAGPPMLAHKGTREGEHVAEVIAGHTPKAIDYTNVPSVTYCHPEVASVGLTEEQAKAKGIDYQVGRFPFSANGRARATDETDGFVKIIREKKYGEIIGAHIVSGHASEMIGELVMARTNEYTVEEVDLAIHAHPTLSEAIGRGRARLDGPRDPYLTDEPPVSPNPLGADARPGGRPGRHGAGSVDGAAPRRRGVVLDPDLHGGRAAAHRHGRAQVDTSTGYVNLPLVYGTARRIGIHSRDGLVPHGANSVDLSPRRAVDRGGAWRLPGEHGRHLPHQRTPRWHQGPCRSRAVAPGRLALAVLGRRRYGSARMTDAARCRRSRPPLLSRSARVAARVAPRTHRRRHRA